MTEDRVELLEGELFRGPDGELVAFRALAMTRELGEDVGSARVLVRIPDDAPDDPDAPELEDKRLEAAAHLDALAGDLGPFDAEHVLEDVHLEEEEPPDAAA